MRILFDTSIPPTGGGIRVSYETTRRWLLERGHEDFTHSPAGGRADVALLTWYGVEQVHQVAHRTPTVFFVDSWWHLTAVGSLPRLVVFNTDYLRFNAPWRKDWMDRIDRPGPYPGDAITLHPPVLEAEWSADRLSHEDRYLVTLVNMNKRKGVELFWKLTTDLPHRQFAGVIGSYGKQVTRLGEAVNANIRIFNHGPAHALRDIFEKTDTLIVPSQETYGRVLVEAAYAGVPHRIALAGPGTDETGCASLLPDLDDGKWRIALEYPPTPPFAPPVSENELEHLERWMDTIAGERIR